MPYNNETGYVPLSMQDIMEFYRNRVNLEFNENYTKETFEGSGFWRTYLPAVYKDREIENAITDLLEHFNQTIQNLEEQTFYSESGMISGILKELFKLSTIVADCTIYNLQNKNDGAGKIIIAIEYVDESLQNDISANSVIANTIVNNIGAGIHTDSKNSDKSYLGMIDANGQTFPVYWRVASLINVWVKVTYKKEMNYSLPINDTIIDSVLEQLKSYRFGTVFTPSRFLDKHDFPYFRDSTLSYSLDNGVTYQNAEITPEIGQKYLFSKDNITLENGE